MTRIKDIVCYNTDLNEFNYPEDGFSGRVLLYDSNKFEGVLTDYFQTKLQFVFGIIEKDSIRMYRSIKDDKELPRIYRAKKQGKTKYQGKMGITDRFVDFSIADCSVAVLEPDTYRDYDHEEELKQTKENVEKFKKQLGKESKALYEDLFYPEIHKCLQKKAQNQ